MKAMHSGMQVILEGFYECPDKYVEVNTSSNSCHKLFPAVISFLYGVPEGKDFLDVQQGTWDYG